MIKGKWQQHPYDPKDQKEKQLFNIHSNVRIGGGSSREKKTANKGKKCTRTCKTGKPRIRDD